jgi:hypothetical protein
VQVVHAVLANRDTPWLLVLDNVASAADLAGLVPASGRGHVLVTSQASRWPAPTIAIKVLDEGSAVDLLIGMSGDPDPGTAAELARELGYLPLALAQAASYVAAQPDLGLAGYLGLYRTRRRDMHAEGSAPDYPHTIATTWRLAFDQLPEPARALLNLACWYAPDTIPLHRLLSPADPDKITLPEQLADTLQPLLADELHRRHAL